MQEHIINIYELQAQSVREANAAILNTEASQAATDAFSQSENHRKPKRPATSANYEVHAPQKWWTHFGAFATVGFSAIESLSLTRRRHFVRLDFAWKNCKTPGPDFEKACRKEDAPKKRGA